MTLLYELEPFCAFGIGDCGSTSNTTITTDVSQKIINDTNINLIKNNIYKNTLNYINKDASNCGSSIQQQQNVSTDIGEITGNISISGIKQIQQSNNNFSCVNISKYANNIAQDISDATVANIIDNNDTNVINKLEQNAESSASTGFLALSATTSDANIQNNYNINQTNKINKTIANTINNEINKTFETANLQTCINNVAQTQSINAKAKKISGDVSISDISQEQTAQSIANCINNNESINATIDNIANTINNISTTKLSNKSETEIKNVAKSEAVTKGLDDLINSLFGNLQNIVIIGIIIVVIIISLIILLNVNKKN